MRRLLELTHRQWLYCNARVHIKLKGGMTAAQYDAILARMEECLLIDPADLLVEDWDLLDSDFDKLTHSPTAYKVEWLAEMDADQGTANHIARGSRYSLRS